MLIMMENKLISNKHILLVGKIDQNDEDLEYVKNNFCGIVCSSLDEISLDTIIYLAGEIDLPDINLPDNNTILIIKEYSHPKYDKYPHVSMGELPININNVGVFFRKFFDNEDYFERINTEHEFQQ